MSYLTNATATHRIDLREFDGSDNWVEIKDRQSHRDRMRIKDSSLSISKEGEGVVSQEKRSYVTLRSSIRAWSLTNDNGQPLPLNEETFSELDGEFSEWLLDQISDHYATNSLRKQDGEGGWTEEAKNSGDPFE